MSKLLDKARGIVFDDEDDESAAPARAPSPPALPALARDPERAPLPLVDGPIERPRTAIGAITASIALGRGVEAENRQLRQRVQELEDATVVEFLDPRSIRASRFANRHETAFAGAEFAALKAEIASSGRNVQPIKVRRIGAGDAADGVRYELAFGHRRHRACLELGIPVAAIVEPMTDPQLFAEMERENRERQNLSAWEQGTMYRRALEAGLFPSLRRLAAAIGAQPGNVSAAIQLASLPDEVVEAFGTPLALQYRWAAPLKDAHERDPAQLAARCREVAEAHPRPAPREVFQRLTAPAAAATDTGRTVLDLMHRGRVVGRWERDERGDVVLRVRAAGLGEARERRLLDSVRRMFETASDAAPSRDEAAGA